MSATLLSLRRVVAPATEPVTLAEAKAFARIDHDHEDALVQNLIQTARDMAEKTLRLSLLTQTHEALFMLDWTQTMTLPHGPVQSIALVEKIGVEDNTEIVNTGHYALGARPDTMHLLLTLAGYTLRVRYVAGYATAADVPMAIRHGMMLHVLQMYEQRAGAERGVPTEAMALYAPFKRGERL